MCGRDSVQEYGYTIWKVCVVLVHEAGLMVENCETCIGRRIKDRENATECHSRGAEGECFSVVNLSELDMEISLPA